VLVFSAFSVLRDFPDGSPVSAVCVWSGFSISLRVCANFYISLCWRSCFKELPCRSLKWFKYLFKVVSFWFFSEEVDSFVIVCEPVFD